jgi:RNA polymerase sigma factor (sigma-70 family)
MKGMPSAVQSSLISPAATATVGLFEANSAPFEWRFLQKNAILRERLPRRRHSLCIMSTNSFEPTMDDLIRHSAWLKRLARSLVTDPHLADDFIQETWVSALENPPRHIGNHRNWLGRVLRNQVTAHFRSNSRRTAREQRRAKDAEVLDSDAARYTESVVERGEVSQMLADSVMELEEPFRATLLMRFQEGLTPTEIAERMNAKVGTVRTRLNRGLEKLRQIVWNRHGKNWPECHNALVLFAGVAKSTPWWTPMKAAIAATVAVGTLAMLAIQPWKADPQAVTSADLGGMEPASVNSVNAALAGPVEADRTPSGEDSSSKPGSSAMGEEIVIQGRCIDGNSLDPIEGVQVKFSCVVYKTSGERFVREGWEQPMELVTGADGLFEFRTLDSDDFFLYEITMTHPQYMTRFGEWISNENPLESTDFGDVWLQTGTTLSGTVKDQDGNPMEGVEVRFELPASANLIPLHSDPLWTEAVTGSSGEFQLPSVTPSGRHQIQLRKTAYLPSGAQYLEIPNNSTLHAELEMELAPFLEGQITFTDGTPADSVKVRVVGQDTNRMPTSTTESDGRFRIYSNGATVMEPITLALLNLGGQSHQSKVSEATYQWNDSDIQLTVEPAHHLNIEVVAADTGEPIEAYKARCNAVNLDWRLMVDDYRDPGHHPEGELRIDGLNAGPHRLNVEAVDRQYRGPKNLEVTPSLAESDTVRIEMQKYEPLEVLVRKPDGSPAANSRIRLSVPSTTPFPQTLASGETDNAGLFMAYYPPEKTRIDFHISGDHVELTESFDLSPTDPHHIAIEVEAFTIVSGTLNCEESLRSVATLFFEQAAPEGGMGWFSSSDSRLTTPSPTGEFSIGLEAGVYNVYLKLLNEKWDRLDRMAPKWLDIGPPLTQVEVTDQATEPLVIDASHIGVFDFEGRVLLDGVLLRNAEFRLQRFQMDTTNPRVSMIGKYFTDENGKFQMQNAIAGRYQVSYDGSESGNPWPMALRSDHPIVIDAPPQQTPDFQIQTRTLRLRPLHWETGEPMPGTVWTTGMNGTGFTTDADGWITVTPCALKTYFNHKGSYGQILLGLIELDPLLTEQEIEIQVDPPHPNPGF